MEMFITSETYKFCFLKLSSSWFQMFFTLNNYINRPIEIGDFFLLDKAALYKMQLCCKYDDYNYFRGIESQRDNIVNVLELITLALKEDEKARFYFV